MGSLTEHALPARFFVIFRALVLLFLAVRHFPSSSVAVFRRCRRVSSFAVFATPLISLPFALFFFFLTVSFDINWLLKSVSF
jgi:hypothetical protein